MLKKIFIILFLFTISNIFSQTKLLKTYYPSGKVESRLSFIDEILEGTSFWYYQNGNIKTEKDYINGVLSGSIKHYYENGLLKNEISVTKGMLDGYTKYYYSNGALKEIKTYDLGKLINLQMLDYDSNYIAPLSAYDAGKRKRKLENNDFICPLEICPEPVGGIEELESNIVYPKLARQFKLEGEVLLTATIDVKGIAKDIKIIKGIGLGCDEAAIEAVKKTKFIPGRNNGDEIETEVTFKLNFRIDEPDDKIGIPQIAPGNSVNKDSDHMEANSFNEFIECNVEVCPKPVGGIVKLLNNLRYPPQAKRNNISGEVIVKAKINELGFVVSADVEKGIGYGCDEAAKSVIIKTEFEPGKVDGKNVESEIKITVPFILDEKLLKQ